MPELDPTTPFDSQQQVIDAMRASDSLGRRRYDTDSNYRALVERKLELDVPGVTTAVIEGTERGAARSE